MTSKISHSRQDFFSSETQKQYFLELQEKLHSLRQEGEVIFPQEDDIFTAYTSTPLSTLKVVILGQDPYHGDGQAHGLAFSVPDDLPCPPSLRNIYKEILSDTGNQNSKGNLSSRAKQGVFLLNSVLTVSVHQAGSHADLGWETFTDHTIQYISKNKDGIVFLLRGSYAQSKKELINQEKHLILEAPHPSPLSAWRGFFGCKHFSKTNARLEKNNKSSIDRLANK